MIRYPRMIKNYNAFLDGISFAGLSDTAKLPDLKINVARHRGAGMDGGAPVDMGTEDLNAEVSLKEWSPEALKLIGTRKRLVLRPAAQGRSAAETDTIIATIGGLWSDLSPGELKPGGDVPMKLGLAGDYFRLEINSEEIFEIDLLAGKRVVGGIDQLKELRNSMGF